MSGINPGQIPTIGDGTDLGVSIGPDANVSYIAVLVAVNNVAAVEAIVGAGRLAGRKGVYIFNGSGNNIFYGPAGVTAADGVRLPNNTGVDIKFGDQLGIFMIRGVGAGNVTVQEYK